jgi:hypothetical protein
MCSIREYQSDQPSFWPPRPLLCLLHRKGITIKLKQRKMMLDRPFHIRGGPACPPSNKKERRDEKSGIVVGGVFCKRPSASTFGRI